MSEDLKIRNYADNTIDAYIRSVAQFAEYFGKSPDRLGIEEIRSYQVYLVKKKKISYSTLNVIVAALRFFYRTPLRKPWNIKMIPYAQKPKKLPKVVSQEEILSLLDSITNLKHRAMAMAAYSGGLRVSEVASLRIEDIDSKRMLIHIDQGKGHEDRLVPLSEKLLETLREYYRIEKPHYWLFPGQDPEQHIHRDSIGRMVRRVGAEAIGKHITAHTLRHSNATHMLEAGVNVRTVQGLLGHARLSTTDVYSHVARKRITATKSPLDLLDNNEL
jgi:site-specific recombinase XerD